MAWSKRKAARELAKARRSKSRFLRKHVRRACVPCRGSGVVAFEGRTSPCEACHGVGVTFEKKDQTTCEGCATPIPEAARLCYACWRLEVDRLTEAARAREGDLPTFTDPDDQGTDP